MTADTLTGGSTAAWSVCGPSLREEEGSERVGERERGGEGERGGECIRYPLPVALTSS